MAQAEAREHSPTNDGPETEFQRNDMPLVKVGTIHGRAIAYTRSHGLIEWKDTTGYHCQWFPAHHIHRIPHEQWHGQALHS